MAARDKKSMSVTGRTLENLLNTQDFDSFVNENDENFTEDEFCTCLNRFCEEKNILKSDMVKNSGIERTYAYQLIRGDRSPTRNKVLQFALSLGLNLDETQYLLRVSHQSALYPRIKRDAAIIFCIEHHLSYTETQSMLDSIGEKNL